MGRYYVSIANATGCFTASDVETIPTGITGIDDIDLSGSLKIYPNPTKGLFTIEIDNNILGELNIELISEQGRVIKNIKSEKAGEHYKTEIDLTSQPKGIYFVNLMIGKYLTTKKIVVK